MPSPRVLEDRETQFVVDELWDETFKDAPEWRVVGASGEVAYANAWVAYGGSYGGAEFLKDHDGWVHLRGLVKNGTATTIFTLPPGCRPERNVLCPTISNGVFAYVEILPSGAVTSNGSNVYVSLQIPEFRAFQ